MTILPETRKRRFAESPHECAIDSKSAMIEQDYGEPILSEEVENKVEATSSFLLETQDHEAVDDVTTSEINVATGIQNSPFTNIEIRRQAIQTKDEPSESSTMQIFKTKKIKPVKLSSIEKEVEKRAEDEKPANLIKIERLFVTKIMRQRDGSERVIETSERVSPVEALPEDEEPDKVEDVKDSRGRVTKKVTTSRVFVSTTKTVVKKSQVMPDGREEPVEKDVVESEDTKEVKAPVTERTVKRVVRQPDGREKVVEEKQFVKPFEITETKEDSKPEVTEKRERGKKVRVVKKKVVETLQRMVTKRVTKKPDGKQDGPVEEEVIKPVEPVRFRILRRTVKHPDGRLTVTEEPDFEMPDDAKPSVEEVKDRRGNVVRRVTTKPVAMITVRKVYRTIIISPDGREESVQERVEERQQPGQPDEEEPGRAADREPEREPEKEPEREPMEEVSRRVEIAEKELPEEPLDVSFEDGRVTRKTVTVRKRTIRKVVVMPDGRRKEVEEEVEEPVEEVKERDDYPRRSRQQEPRRQEPEEEEVVKPMEVEEVESAPTEPEREWPVDEDVTRTTSERTGVVRRTVTTVRRRVVKRIIQMPDGTRKEVEEEVPVGDEDEPIEPRSEIRVVEETDRDTVVPVTLDVVGKERDVREPRHVERVFVTKIMRQRDGSERVIETSERVSPVEALPEDEEPDKVEDVKDSRGRVTKKVTTSRVFVSTTKTVVKKSQVMPDGREEPVEKDVVESEDTKEVKAPVTERTVKRVVRQPDGREKVVEEKQFVKPFEITETKEDSKPEVTEKRERGKKVRVVKKKVVETLQRMVTKRVTKKPDGKQDGPAEEEVIKPVEPVRFRILRRTVKHPDGRLTVTEEPDFEMPDDAKPSVEEVKDRRGNVVRRVTTKPVAMITVRKVYRTIIISPDGREESVQERVEERQQPGQPDEEEPGRAADREPEREPEKEPEREPMEEVSRRVEIAEKELPEEPLDVSFEDGRVTRKTVTVRKRTIRKVVVMPDGRRKEVEEEVEEPVEEVKERDDYPRRSRQQEPRRQEPEEEEVVKPMEVEEVESAPTEPEREWPVDEDVTRTTSERTGVVRRTVTTVRRRVVKRIIQMPDGTRKEVEEEVPVGDEDEPIEPRSEIRVVEETDRDTVVPVTLDVVGKERDVREPRHVERVFVTKIMRQRDGSERVIETSERVSPVEALPEDEEPDKVEDVKDSRGRVTKKVTTSRVFVSTTKTVVKKSQVMPDGREEPVEKDVVESEDTKEVKAPVTERTVKRVVRQPDGREKVVEEKQFVKPFEITETKEDSKPEVTEKRERGKKVRVVKKKVVETLQRMVTKRVTKKPDGKQDGPAEEEVIKPVEPVRFRILRRTVKHPDGRLTVTEEPDFEMPDDAKPSVEEVKDRRGNVVRRVTTKPVAMITVRKVYRTIIISPDGREESVQERVEERQQPGQPDEEEPGRAADREPEREPEKEPEREPMEEVSRRVEIAEKELPEEPLDVSFEDGRVTRKTVTVRKRTIRKVVVMPDGRRKEVEEEVEEPVEEVKERDDYPRRSRQQEPRRQEPEEEEVVKPMEVEEVESAPTEPEREWPVDEDVTRTTSERTGVVRRTVTTVRRRVVKRIIQMPDGTRKEVEEEVPVGDEDEPIEPRSEIRVVEETDRDTVVPVTLDVVGKERDVREPRHVERVFVTKIMRQRDGSERVIETSERVSPVEALPEDEEPDKVEDVKDSRGRVTKKVTTSRVFVSTTKTVVKKSQVMPDGREEPVEKDVVESEDTKEVKAPVTERTVKRVVRQPDGREKVVEEKQFVKPFEITETKEDSKPEVTEKRERGKKVRVVKKKVVETLQRMVTKRVTKKPDGKQDGPAEEEVIKPVEPVRFRILRRTVKHPDGRLTVTEEPDFEMPDDAKPSVEEVKDRRGNVVRRVTTKPVAMITVRKVYRTIIISPDGREESVQERVEERQQPGQPDEEEPGRAEDREPEREPEKEPEREPMEEVSRRVEIAEKELPEEPLDVSFEDGRVTRKTVTVRKRTIRKVVVMPDGRRKEVEEEVEEPVEEVKERDDYPRRSRQQEPRRQEPEEEEVVKPMEVEEVESAPTEPEREWPVDEDVTRTTSERTGVVRRTVTTVRRRVVKRIIQMPDGTRKEVEEEVPVGDEDEPIEPRSEIRVVEETDRDTVVPVTLDVVGKERDVREPRHVERVFVTKIMRQRDGSERVIETSERVSPVEALPEDEEPDKVEDVKDSRGRVTKKVTTSRVFVSTTKTVVKKSQVMPDGREEPVEKDVVESEDTKEVKAPVTERTVKRVVRQPDGREKVVEEKQFVKPFEITETKEDSKPEVTEKRERGKKVRVVKKKVVETLQRMVTKRVTKKPDGKQDGPAEEEVIKPVEPVRFRILRRTVKHPDGRLTVTEEPDFEMPDDAKPSVEEVKDRRGNVVRRVTTKPVAMITVRKVYRTIIISPDGREESVQERVEERQQPGQPDEEEPGRAEDREPEREPEKEPEREPMEEVSRRVEIAEKELPEEPLDVSFEDGRVTRKTVTVRKRTIRKVVVMPDGRRKEVEEEVEEPVEEVKERDDYPRRSRQQEPRRQEPEEEEVVKPMEVEEVESAPTEPEREWPVDEDVTRTTSERTGVVRRTVTTVRRRVVKRIIQMPDGTRKEVEEEVPVGDEDEPIEPRSEIRVVEETDRDTVVPVTLDVVGKERDVREPRHVERVFVTKIMRQRDGSERVIETSERVSPVEALPEDEEPDKVEDVKDSRGRVTKKVTTSRVFVSTTKTVVKKSQVMPDGREEPVEKDVVESEDTKEVKAPVTERTVKRVVRQPDGREKVVEEKQFVKPFEITETKEDSKPEVTEKRERGKKVRVVKKKVVETLQRMVTKRVTKKPDGKQDGPAEEEVIKPVEPVRFRILRRTVKHPDGRLTVTEEPDFEMPDDAKPSVEEVKDRRGNVVRRVTTKPVAMITVRKVYRTIIISPDGREESVQERVEERQQPGQPDEEEPGRAEDREPEREPEKEPEREPMEEVSRRVEIAEKELPEEPLDVSFEDGRVTRKTVTVRKRTIRKVVVMPDGRRKEVEEEVEEPVEEVKERDDYPRRSRQQEPRRQEPEEEEVVKPMEVEEVESAPTEPEREWPVDEDVTRTTSERTGVVRRTVTTVRRRVVKRIIQMPDGTRKEVEEEVPVGDEDEPIEPRSEIRVVEETDRDTVVPVTLDVVGKERDVREPRHVERVFVTKIMRQRDGSERVIETSERVSPVEALPEDEEPDKVEDVKDSRGRVTKKVTTSRVFVSTTKTVVKKSQVMPDGREEPVEKDVVESEDTKEVKAPVTERTVKRVVRQPDGREKVVEEKQFVKPFEITETKEDSKPEVTEKRERGKKVRVVKKKVVETLQRMVTKRVTKKPDGKQDGPAEEEVIKPVEPVRFRILRRTVKHPDGRLTVTEEPDFEMPDDAKPSVEEVKDRRGNVVRRVTTKPVAMITVRKVYRTIIISPDGREESVQERVEERQQPGQPDEEEPGRAEDREPEREPEKEPEREPMEEVSRRVEIAEKELPEEPLDVSFEDGRVTRKTVTVRKRTIRKVVVMPDGRRKEVEEEVEEPVEEVKERDDYPRRSRQQEPRRQEPEEEEVVKPMEVEEVESAPTEPEREWPVDEDVTRTTSERTGVVRRTVTTVRRRVVKRIIQMPDGTRKEVEEEVPVGDEDEPIEPRSEIRVVEETDRDTVVPVTLDVVGKERDVREPRHVERVFVTKIMRQRDGSERVIETSERVSPVEALPEDEEPDKVEDVKDSRGRVTKKVTTSRVFVSTTKTVVKKSQVMPDGREEPVEKDVVESEDTKEVKAPVTERTVKRVVRQPDGREKVVEEKQFVKPFEITETKEDSKPEVTEKRERGKKVRVVKKKVVETLQRMVTKRVTKKPDGKQDGPAEEEVIKPVEPVRFRILRRTVKHPDGRLTVTEEPDFEMPDDAKPSVEEVKDRRGNVVRRVTTKPVAMITVRKVYRTIIISPDGREESVQERVEERQQPGQPDEEEPGRAEDREPEREPEKEPEREPMEEVSRRVEIAEKELPEEPLDVSFEDGRVTRKTVTVRKRTIRKVVVMPDGRRKEVEEEVEEPVEEVKERDDYPRRSRQQEPRRQEPEEEEVVKPMEVEEVESAPTEPEREWPVDEDVTRTTSERTGVVRRTVTTVRRRVVKRIIQMPDGTRKEVEEEVPVGDEDEPIEPRSEIRVVEETDRDTVVPVTLDVVGKERDVREPRHVERVFVTKIMRQRDGSERVIETSERVSPVEALPEDEEPDKVEDVKDSRGRVTKKVTTSRVFVSTTKTVVKKSQVMPDGREEPVEKDVVESEDTKEVKAPVTERTVKRVVRQPDGREKVVEEKQFVKPFEITETKEDSKPEVTEKRERGKKVRVVKKKVVETLQRMVTKRVTKKPDGKQDGPAEEEVLKPVEFPSTHLDINSVSDKIDDDNLEFHDGKGVLTRRVVIRSFFVITTRKVFRTVLLSPDGSEESVQERVEDYRKESKDIPRAELPERVQTLVAPNVSPSAGATVSDYSKPKLIEKVSITRILRHDDGTEQLIGKSESLSPLYPNAEDERPEYMEEIKDAKGNVTHRVTVTPVYYFAKKEFTRKSRLTPNGQEELTEEQVTKEEERSEVKAPVLKRINKRMIMDHNGEEKTDEDVEYVEPFELREEAEEKKPVFTDELERGKKTKFVKRTFKETSKTKCFKKVYKKGSGLIHRPEEEVRLRYVEPASFTVVDKKITDGNGQHTTVKEPVYSYPEDAVETSETIKDKRGNPIKVIITKPVAIITARKIARVIVLAPDGTEQSVQEQADEGEQIKQLREFLPAIDGSTGRYSSVDGREDEGTDSLNQYKPVDGSAKSSFTLKMVEGTTSLRPGDSPRDQFQGIHVDITEQRSGTSIQTKTLKTRLVHRTVQLPDGNTKEIEEWMPIDTTKESDKRGPNQVEKIVQTKILRSTDGSERVIETSTVVADSVVLDSPEEQTNGTLQSPRDNLVFLRKEALLEKTFKVDSDGEETLHESKQLKPETTELVEVPLLEKGDQTKDDVDADLRKWVALKPYSVFVATEEGGPETSAIREKNKTVKVVRRTIRERKHDLVSKKKIGDKKGNVTEAIAYPVEPLSWEYAAKTVILPDGKESVVEEPVYELSKDVQPTYENIKDKRGQIVKKIVKEPLPAITARKVFETIIVSPKGAEISRSSHTEKLASPIQPESSVQYEPESRKGTTTERMVAEERFTSVADEVLERPSVDEQLERIEDSEERFVIRGGKKFIASHNDGEEKDATSPVEFVYRVPKRVERLFTTVIERSKNGQERVLQESEAILPIDADEDMHERTDEVKDKHGTVVSKVTSTPIGVTQQSMYVKKSTLLPDGKQIPKGKVLSKQEEPKQTTPIKLKRSEGKGKPKDGDHAKPYKLREVKVLSKPEVILKKEYGDNVRLFKEKVVETVQNRAVKRVWKTPGGSSQGPEEEVIIEPAEVFGYEFVTNKGRRPSGKEVEAVEPVYQLPSHVFTEPGEVKDKKGNVTKRFSRNVLPVVTARKVYRVVIITPQGEEVSVNERVMEQEVPAEHIEEKEQEMLFPAVQPIVADAKKRTTSPDRKSPVAGSPDRKSPVAGSPDRKSPVAGSPDRKSPVAGSPDRKSPVAGSPDRKSPVAGSPDRKSPVAGSPDRKSPVAGSPDRKSPVAGRKSPTAQNKKSPVADRKTKPDDKRSQSPEANAPNQDYKSRVSPQASKRKVTSERKPKVAVEEVIPIMFSKEVESAPEELIFDSVPNTDSVLGIEPVVRLTAEEKEDMANQLFHVEVLSGEDEPQVVKERKIPRRFESAVKKVTYMTYWQKLKNFEEKRPIVQPVEEHIVRYGRRESQLKTTWEEIVNITEIREEKIDFDSYSIWLTFVERELASLKPVSYRYDVLEEQRRYNEVRRFIIYVYMTPSMPDPSEI